MALSTGWILCVTIEKYLEIAYNSGSHQPTWMKYTIPI